MATAEISHPDFPTPEAPNFGLNAPAEAQGAQLHTHLDRLAARRNRLRLWHEISVALCWGVGISALGVLAYKFYLLDGQWWMPALIIAFSALIGYRNGALKRSGAFDAALDADQTLNLNDRLASALAFTHPDLIRHRTRKAEMRFWPRLRAMLFPRPAYATSLPSASTSLVPALVADAVTRAGSLDAKAVYPMKFGRPQKSLAGLTVAFSGFIFMPDMPQMLSQEQRTDARKTLPDTGKKLQAVAKEVQDKKEIKDPETKQLAKQLAALGKRMERARMGKKRSDGRNGSIAPEDRANCQTKPTATVQRRTRTRSGSTAPRANADRRSAQNAAAPR